MISQSVSNYLATRLSYKVPYDGEFESVEDQIEVYEYSINFYFGMVIKGSLLIALASILGVLVASLVTMLTFGTLRLIGGGYHFQEFKSCLVISLLQFLSTALIAQHTYYYWSQTNILSLLIFSIISSIYIIIRYVPRDTINKPIVEPFEIRKFKRWSLYYLLSWTVTMTIFIIIGWKLIILSSCFGLLLELFSISKMGFRLYSFLER